MADFAKALGRTLKNEGTYSLDPADPGGETVFGISRRWHPEWTGWATIDSLKPRVGTIDPNDIIASALIKHDVEAFYKTEFWDKFNGDAIINREFAEFLFDCSVNLDVPAAVLMLQRAVNVCNNDGKLWLDIVADGHFGPATLAAVNAAGVSSRANTVLQICNALRAYTYVTLMEADHKKERFIGWFARCVILPG